ncbi:two-component system histidine kinase PnpS [Lacticaseibacillus hulanensis]|uniref:two-component system histidine kinase PnpS n=1 Tax=Lacticaseibacillus hulanensis TaxID=2493111 RepID=UPI000FD811D9|nr:ATP-binding protein [Lacticaseibacillus hulanensis]
MLKHERTRIIVLGLLAIVGFFALGFGASEAVHQHQRESLKTVSQLVTSTTKVPAGVDMHIVDLEGDSIRARDLRSHTVSGHAPRANSYDLIHIHGVPELVYRARINGKLMAITQRRQGLMTVAPQTVIITTLIYWLVVISLLASRLIADSALRRELQSLSSALRELRQGNVAKPVLVTKHSRLYGAVRETQLLNDSLTSMRRHMRVRSTRFTRLIDNLPQGIMLVDTDRDVVLTNPAFGDLLGIVIGDGEHPYVDDVKEYELVHCIEDVLANGASNHQELTIAQTGRTVDATVVPIRDSDAVVQVLVILYDVTEMHHVEQMQSDFVANVSHELKTPVTAISGFAETLLGGAKDDPATLTQFLTIIQKESKRLTTLINDILTLQRGGVPEEQREVNISEIINTTVNNLRKPAAKRDVKVSVTVPEEMTIISSPGRLTQIVRNLVDNAVFYNRNGGSVHVVATQDGAKMRLTVTDTGIGIPKADQERIFERFYRVDKARSRNNGGTGLGLAITADAVRALDGSISLESEPGVGTKVTVVV